MNRPHLIPLLAGLAAACGNPDAPSGAGGGATSASSGGVGVGVGGQGSSASTSAALPSTSVSGPVTSSTTTGTGGSVAWGAPQWQPSTTLLDCPVDRLANPAEVKAFTFKPCDFASGCDELVLAPAFQWLLAQGIARATYLEVYAGAPRMVFVGGGEYGGVQQHILLMVDLDGQVVDGMRNVGNACALFAPAVSGDRFLAGMRQVDESGFFTPEGVLGATAGDPELRTQEFEKPIQGFGPVNARASADRVMWPFEETRLFSVALHDGGGLRTIEDKLPGSIDVSPAVSLGSHFVYALGAVVDGAVRRHLKLTDGLSPGTVLFEPPVDYFDLAPGFTGSHIAFLRGYKYDAQGDYESLAVWAAAIQGTEVTGAPFKVADHPGTHTNGFDEVAAGHGYFVARAWKDAHPPDNAILYDIAGKTSRELPIPEGAFISSFMGVTATHFWAGLAKASENKTRRIVRYAMKP